MATFNMTLEMANEYYRATDGGAHPPWTKEQRAAMAQADLQAGRIKLPDHDFKREYLGEWKDHADAMAYATTATRPAMVHQKCALCSIVLDLGPEATFAQTYEATMAAHHAVCPKRPIAVGDYVSWEIGRTDRDFIHGEVERMTDGVARVRITAASQNQASIFNSGCISHINQPVASLRRIPRPAEAQATGEVGLRRDPSHVEDAIIKERYAEPPVRRVFPRGADRSQPCETCGAMWGEHFGVACESPRMEGYEVGPVCSPGCECGAHGPRKYRPVVVDRAAMERAERDEKLMQRMQDATEARIRYLVTGGTKVHTLAPPPAPMLVEGMPLEVCAARWWENRFAVEGGAAPPNVLTPAQLIAGRAAWLAGPGAYRSAALRAKVAASAEAERCRVRVDLQDVE